MAVSWLYARIPSTSSVRVNGVETGSVCGTVAAIRRSGNAVNIEGALQPRFPAGRALPDRGSKITDRAVIPAFIARRKPAADNKLKG